jgi:hypothetical protein
VLFLCFLLSSVFQRFSILVAVLSDRFQHVGWCGVVAKSFTHVDEKIFVPGSKHKAPAKLQRIFSQPMLLVSCRLGPLARLQVIFAQKMEQGSMAQTYSFVRFAFFIDEKRELDARFLAEELGIAGIAKANYGQMRAFFLELGFKFAQLRDVLSAEYSTVMPKKDHHGRSALPQGAEPGWLAVGVRKRDSSQLAAE